MKKSALFEKRKKARELKKKGWSNLKIARYLVANKDSIKKWLEMDEEDLRSDRRGCRPDARTKYGELERERVMEIRRQLVNESGARKGSRHIKERYLQVYGDEISEWFINKTIRQHRDRKREPSDVRSRLSSYKLPARFHKGKVVMSLEFLGLCRLKNSGDSSYYLACKYLEPFCLGVVSKVLGRSCDEVVRVLRYTWGRYRIPDFVKMPYNRAFGVNFGHDRCVGSLTLFLLNLGIIPFYVPVERNFENVDLFDGEKIFSAEFSNRLAIGNKQCNGYKIESFYMEYSGNQDIFPGETKQKIKFPHSLLAEELIKNRNVKDFPNPFIYFIQIARGPAGMLRVLSYDIELDRAYIGQPLFCKLDLKKKELLIYSNHNKNYFSLIKKIEFWVRNLNFG